MTEQTITASILDAVKDLADLMNQARAMGISVSFSINEDGSARSKKFKPALTITKTLAEL